MAFWIALIAAWAWSSMAGTWHQTAYCAIGFCLLWALLTPFRA